MALFGALGTAFGIGKKLFKGIRSRNKQKRLDRRLKKQQRKEKEIQKQLSGLITGGAGLQSFSQPLSVPQELTFNEAGIDFGLGGGGGKIFKGSKALNSMGTPSSGEATEDVYNPDAMQASGMMAQLKGLPMWAKVLGVVALLFVAWKLFISKRRRR